MIPIIMTNIQIVDFFICLLLDAFYKVLVYGEASFI